MSNHRKEKRNPSSRYARVEEPWLDERDEHKSGADSPEPVPNAYGVRDSYSRQASYGRPEGYYPDQQEAYYRRDPYYGDERAGREGRNGYDERYGYDERIGRDGRYGYDDRFGYDERIGREARNGYDERYGYDERIGREGRNGYDERYGYDERIGREDRYGYDDRFGYDERIDRDAAGRGKKRSRPQTGDRKREPETVRKSKKGFVVKLILLLIAACVLVVVWRFSRMKHVSLNDILTNEGVVTPSGYREFVIYGVDSREGNLTQDAHSDTIIICSMNQSTREIRMVSVYRDTYLDNTNGEYRKATECYFFGGSSRSVNMLNKNLDLDLKDYITVDFNAVVKAVDLIGGVDVDVTEEELPYINGYQTENAEVTGAQITPVESAGYQHLNGIQALAYCRIRYTAGSDYRRTERQRTVLSQIFEKAKSQGPVRMAQIVDTMLPYIATSFSSTELLGLATSISGSTMLDSVGFPFELQAANIAAGDCVVPVNLAQNVSELHAYLYQQTGYTPTQIVQDISNEIANTTGIY